MTKSSKKRKTSQPTSLAQSLRQAITQEWLAIYCVLVGAVFSLAPRLFGLLYGYLDPSFNYAFNQAAANHLAFGSTFISTYGPLGYLISNYLPQNLTKITIWIVLYALALGVGTYLFTKLYVAGTKWRLLIATILLYIMTVTNGGDSFEWNLLSLFILYCFIYFKLRRRHQYILAGCLAAVAAVFCLIKFTTGIGALSTIILLPLFIPGIVIRRRLEQIATVLGIFLVVFLSLGSYLGIRSFVGYAKTAALLSNGFSTAMPVHYSGTIFATIAIGLSMLGLVVWLLVRKQPLTSAKYIFLLPVLFLMWKYSVVRQDAHMLRSVQIIWPLAALILFSRPKILKKDVVVAVALIALSSAGVLANKIPFTGPASFGAVAVSPLANIKHIEFIRAFEFNNQKREWAKSSALGLQAAQLPTNMREQIGKQSVDVFPWETDIVAANGLTWQPRPSPFSFETYDPYLDNANAAYFASPSADTYIVWHNAGGAMSIDDRNIVWDEPKTFRTIMADYKVVDSTSNFMLLKKRSQPLKLAETSINLGKINASKNHWTQLPNDSTNNLFAYFDVQHSPVEKLQTTLLRGKTYQLSLKTVSGAVHTYRFVAENSSQGLLVGNVPYDWSTLVAQLSGDSPSRASNSTVAIKIVSSN